MVSKFTTAIAIAFTAVLLDNGIAAAASLRQTSDPVSGAEVAHFASSLEKVELRGESSGLEKQMLFLPRFFAVVDAPIWGPDVKDQEPAYSEVFLHRASVASGNSESAPELARRRPR